MNSNDIFFINFLKDFIIKIENKTISDKERKDLIDFFIQTNLFEPDEIIEDKNIMKYFTLGWNIYKNLQN